MIDAFSSLLSLFTVWLKTRVDLRAENLMLRYQLDVLQRSIPKRVRMTKIDRLIFVWLYRLWPASIGAIRIIHPKTLIRWHREGFRLYWRWKSRPRNGRPRVSAELRALNSPDEPTKSALGCTSDSRRIAEVGFRYQRGHGLKVSATATLRPGSALEDVRRQPSALHGLDRFSGGPDSDVQTTFYSRCP
jgi:hypothetical protein